MSNEELLERASKQMEMSFKVGITKAPRLEQLAEKDLQVQRSIADSLLVIARNSMPEIVETRVVEHNLKAGLNSIEIDDPINF